MESRKVSQELIKFFISVKKFFKSNNDNSSSITHQQFITMINLKRLDKSNLKELSQKIIVSTSSLCIMLNKMVDEGFVKREIDCNDRRNTFYSLTPKGTSLLEKELNQKLIQLDIKLDKLSYEKKERLYNSLIDIREILDEIR